MSKDTDWEPHSQQQQYAKAKPQQPYSCAAAVVWCIIKFELTVSPAPPPAHARAGQDEAAIDEDQQRDDHPA